MERDRAILSRDTGCDADEAHPLPDDGRGTPEAESILFGEFPRSDHLPHGLRGTPQEGAAQALKRKNRTIGRRSCRQSTEMFFLSAPVRFPGRFRPVFFCISYNTSYRSRMMAFGGVYGGCTGVTGKRRYGRKDSSVRKEARKRASRSRNGNRTAHRIDSVTVSAAVSSISYRHDAACRAFSDPGACGNGARTACFLRTAPLRKRFVTRRCDVLSFRRSVPCGRTARRNVR